MKSVSGRAEEPNSSARSRPRSALINASVGVLVLCLALGILVGGFFLVNPNIVSLPNLATLPIALVWGIAGVTLLIYGVNRLLELLPERQYTRFIPFLFIGPAGIMLVWALLAPMVRTVIDSLREDTGDGAIGGFLGLANYIELFTRQYGGVDIITAVRNNAVWIVVGTLFTIILGLVISTLAEGRRGERLIKTLIFMPMAISLVGAGVIWNFVYAFRPEGDIQIGLLNAIVTAFGSSPQGWTTILQPWNNLFLIVIMIWLQTGFAMVFFSAALRGVPQEIVESARVDGASESRVFFSIRLPYIWGTVVAVATTMVIFNLKIFDIILVMTGANFGTEVLATAYYKTTFTQTNPAIGSSVAVILLVLVIPAMLYNLYQFRKQAKDSFS